MQLDESSFQTCQDTGSLEGRRGLLMPRLYSMTMSETARLALALTVIHCGAHGGHRLCTLFEVAVG